MQKISRRAFSLGAGMTAALAAPAIAQSKKVLRMQSVDPASFVGPSIVLPRFGNMLEEMTGGALSVEVYSAGQVVPTSEIPSGLAAGLIDLAYTGYSYYTGRLPENVLSYGALPPALIPTVEDGHEVYLHLGVDEIIDDAWKSEGVKSLGSVFLGDPISFWSKEPIRNVAGLSGFKVRSFAYAAKTLEVLGASPVFMPHEEVYTALAQGAIDGSMTSASYYKRANYFEVAPYFYDAGWYNFTHMGALASLATWDSLSDEHKGILKLAVRQLSRDMQHFTWLEYRKMLTEFESMGTTLIKWAPEDVAAVHKAAQSLLPEIRAMSENVDRGIDIISEHVEQLYPQSG